MRTYIDGYRDGLRAGRADRAHAMGLAFYRAWESSESGYARGYARGYNDGQRGE